MPDTIISIEGLTKDYAGKRAVDNLTLEIKKGEVFGLLGPNGAGKTTTILMSLGLTEPTAGEVKIKGYNSSRQPLKVKKVVGYLPDQVGFYENRTGLENIIYTARLNNIDKEKALKSAEKLLEIVGLLKVKDDLVKTYSRGMRQRLGLADVLIKEPEIIILDEPTIGIDPKGINEFLKLIKRLSKEQGITVLLSSHLLHQVQQICDRVGIFVDGKLLAVGDIDDLAKKLFADQQIVIEVGLENNEQSIIDELKSQLAISEINVQQNKLIIKSRENISAAIADLIIKNGSSITHLSTKEYGLDEIYQYYFEGGVKNGKTA